MRKWWIVGGVALCALLGALLWPWSISQKQFRPIAPSKNTEINRAFCAKKIERVRVVHLIPGELNKPVTLGKLDPEFVRHAQRTLDRFWQGEIVVVVTNNGGALFPVSDREMTLAFSQDTDGPWRAFALLYEENHLMKYLQVTASQDDSLMKEARYDKIIPPGTWTVAYQNETGNFGGLLYEEKSGEFHNIGDGDGKRPSKPKLFVRSLQDIVAGRCDRLMSEAVKGPEAWKRPVKQVGEF